ncbi:PqqD family peptide modification chaperone [Uliginosibacterium aquaticum]|uniref:Efflux RND transporter periplasmic adaptor subunit n=1 Tax=Uliginosibacterium aquaticum TaxID=2731212 RepID=A0ABX2IDH5_9RHOO|nr:PqqD family peptide modification chaperone [Uliginosibacterium aquaticum]NSL54498.1 efflux RND transporter periplasmic adaptor subunit [Uliginosibacterium aquaticum]
MSESLFSPYWYRAAHLHPQLAGNTRITRQVFRDEQWYVLSNQASGRQFRVNRLGYQLIGRLDGQHSVQDIWDGLIRELGQDAPSQHEVLRVLSELAGAGMLRSESSPDLGGIFEATRRRRQQGASRLNPLAFRLPLWNPAPVLDLLAPATRWLFTRPAVLLWTLLTLGALLLTQLHWPELRAYASLHVASPRNLLLLWLTYPTIKLVHEFAHALAVRIWGGDVHELGVTFFLVMPVPYVDASSASAFPERHRRILVSAAGVMTEVAIASLALLLWLNLNDGVLRELAFACMLIGGVSTVLVNANPLMRFDGYYVFADALEMPGLAARADAWLRYLGERWLLGNRELPAPPGTEHKRLLLSVFGAASLIYRISLLLGMALWLGSKQLLLGALLGLWLLLHFALLPGWRLLRLVFAGRRLHSTRGRAIAGLTGLLLASVVLLGVLPMPWITRAEGLVWVPDEARVRNEEEGFVSRILVSNGQSVSAGTPLLELENRELKARASQLASRLASREQAYQGSLLSNPAEAIALAEEVHALQTEQARMEERLASLLLRAPVAGIVGMPNARDLEGRFFARGNVLANVLNPATLTVRAVLGQQDIELLRATDPRVEIRIAGRPRESLVARSRPEQPAAGYQLPSALLGERGGGPFLTDPADPDGLRTLEPVFTLDFEIPGKALPRIGERARVHIYHAPRPLAVQWWRSLRQAFEPHFGGAGA